MNDEDDGTIEEVPIRTLPQEILTTVADTTQNALDIDYSIGELTGTTVVDYIARRYPIVKTAVYGLSSIMSGLRTVDTYLEDAPLFGDDNAAPFGTTEADLNDLNRLIPKLSQAKLQRVALGSEQEKRFFRIGHTLNKLQERLKHAEKVRQRHKELKARGEKPVAQKKLLITRSNALAGSPQRPVKSTVKSTVKSKAKNTSPAPLSMFPLPPPTIQLPAAPLGSTPNPDLLNIALRRVGL